MGCFSGRLMSSASDQKLFCKLSSRFCCSFDEFVEEKVISPSYSSAILTPPGSHHLCLQRICYLVRERERKVNFCNNSFSSFNKNIENKYYYYMLVLIYSTVVHIVEKAMAPHSSTLAWKIPWTEEPGRLQSKGSLSRTRLSDFAFIFHFHALEKGIQPTPVFLPGESQGWGSLVGCRLWGRTESDMTEAT